MNYRKRPEGSFAAHPRLRALAMRTRPCRRSVSLQARRKQTLSSLSMTLGTREGWLAVRSRMYSSNRSLGRIRGP